MEKLGTQKSNDLLKTTLANQNYFKPFSVNSTNSSLINAANAKNKALAEKFLVKIF